MTLTRTLTGLAITAAALVSISPAAAQAATGPADAVAAETAPHAWGPYYAPGHRAKAFGSLSASGENHEVIPSADTVKVTGKLYDSTRASSSCGWAVYQIAIRNATGNNLHLKQHSIRTCSFGAPKSFSFKYHDVYQVELKVCSEGKASKPSIVCLSAGTWKILYTSPH